MSAKILTNKKVEFKAPFLLDKAALLELGELVESERSKLEATRNRRIEEHVKERLSTSSYAGIPAPEAEEIVRSSLPYRLESSNLSFTFKLDDGSECVSEGMRDAVIALEDSPHTPIALKIHIESAQVRVDLDIAPFMTRAAILEAGPAGDAGASSVWFSLKTWLDARESPWIARTLKAWGSALGITSLAGFALLGMGVFGSSHDPVRESAIELLEGGISPAETSRALELVMQKIFELNAPAAQTASVAETTLIWVLLVMATIWLISVPIPNVRFGLGKARFRHTVGRLWIWVLTRGLPFLVISAVLVPLVSKLIGA